MQLLVTGGAGFIGSAVCREIIANTPHTVVNVDKLTYAANLASLKSIERSPRYEFIKADICDREAMRSLLAKYGIDAILHLAAESHVDRSIDGPAAFLETNVMGTFSLLEAARERFSKLKGDKAKAFRFVHISTDEVFGSLEDTGHFLETTRYDPSSPYSASKAAADHLVRAWQRTFGLPALLCNASNNYGPYQFPEKLIPLTIARALDGRSIPVYGKGENVRDWLFVEDFAQAILKALMHGKPGESYNVGSRSERRNIDIVKAICSHLDQVKPRNGGLNHAQLISFVTDRPGHDHRYAIDPSKIKHDLGWEAQVPFDAGIKRTVGWYIENESWWRPIEQHYAGERLGLGAVSANAS
jgi:dTDP-glucose 4,6-dehydratase